MKVENLTVEARDHVLFMGLNRPAKYNAFDLDLYHSLSLAYGELERNRDLRCGVLFAHGDHFTGGIDLPQWAPRFAQGKFIEPAKGGGLDPLALDENRTVSKPIVIAVQGWCLTIGLELLLAADIRIAADNARFAQIEPRRGIYAIGGATVRLQQEIGWGNAMRYLLTSDEFSANQALRLGLVQEVVPVGAQLARATAIAVMIAEQAPLAVQATLRSARIARSHGAPAAIAQLAPDMVPLLNSEDAKEGIASFIESRTGRFTGQ
jgi:enoyl-CoA hydratase